MSGTDTKTPVTWKVIGNIAPVEVSEPSTTDVFTVTNCTLTLETGVLVDGNLLIPVKSTTSF